MFDIVKTTLPHLGIIPGARGHKKEIIPVGTEVWLIMYKWKVYWVAYQDEKQAIEVATNLERSEIPFETLIAWNFKREIPRKVARRRKDG